MTDGNETRASTDANEMRAGSDGNELVRRACSAREREASSARYGRVTEAARASIVVPIGIAPASRQRGA